MSAPLPAESARALLTELRSSLQRDPLYLPPYASKSVKSVTEEMNHTHQKLSAIAEEANSASSADTSVPLAAAAEVYWQYMTFAKRALCVYTMARRDVIIRAAWDPRHRAGEELTNASVSEAAFANTYRDALRRLTDRLPGGGLIELHSYTSPPSSEMVRVTALRTVPDVLTEDGEVSLTVGATLLLRAPVAENLVRLGYCALAEGN